MVDEMVSQSVKFGCEPTRRIASALIELEDALRSILEDVVLQDDLVENVPLNDCLGLRLAEPFIAPRDVPPAANSAMDGYAVASHALVQGLFDSDHDQVALPITQWIAAGDQVTKLEIGDAARILTGAEIPEGADLVVEQELCQRLGSEIEPRVLIDQVSGLKPFRNIRGQGQDIEKGTHLLPKGHRLGAVELGVIASLGTASLLVLRPLRVAILSTGAELVAPGQPLAAGKIYNSNSALLSALIREMGHIPVDIGIATDTLAATQRCLTQAAETADIVLSTGGVSVGDEDHVKQALATLGEQVVWKLAIKPGKPLLYGKINSSEEAENSVKTPFFGLPGNPASVLVTALVVGRPYLMAMLGLGGAVAEVSFNSLLNTRSRGMISARSSDSAKAEERALNIERGAHDTLIETSIKSGKARVLPGGIEPEKHRAAFVINKPEKRQQFLRARCYQDDQGNSWVDRYPNQSSGVLSSAIWGNGFAVIPIGEMIKEGDLIEFYPFYKLMN